MSRWLRALVIALLIPAYGLAAIGVAAFVPTDHGVGQVLIEGQQNPESLSDGFSGNVADLSFELGDTSDDAAELPAALTQAALTAPPGATLPTAADARPQAKQPEQPRRPPKAIAPRV
jgi:hypothetical protein